MPRNRADAAPRGARHSLAYKSYRSQRSYTPYICPLPYSPNIIPLKQDNAHPMPNWFIIIAIFVVARLLRLRNFISGGFTHERNI